MRKMSGIAVEKKKIKRYLRTWFMQAENGGPKMGSEGPDFPEHISMLDT